MTWGSRHGTRVLTHPHVKFGTWRGWMKSGSGCEWIPLTLPVIFTPLKPNVDPAGKCLNNQVPLGSDDDDDDCDDDTYQVKGLGWHEMSCLGSEQVLTGIRTFWWGNAVFLRSCSFTRTPCHGNRFSSILCADLGHGLWKKWKSLWVWYQLRETWFQQVLPRNS